MSILFLNSPPPPSGDKALEQLKEEKEFAEGQVRRAPIRMPAVAVVTKADVCPNVSPVRSTS